MRQECGRGVDVVKISASPGHGSSPARDILYLTRDELRAAVDTAHNLGKRVRAHCASRTAILECARAGVDIIDHADRMDRECIDAMLEGRLLRRALHAVDRALPPHRRELGPRGAAPRRSTRASRRRSRRRWRASAACAPTSSTPAACCPRPWRPGVKLVVGDDFGTPVMPHGDYVSELEIYVKQLGIPALEVIRWATQHGAMLLGMGDELGSVEEGKLADLLVVQGDPLDDITCLKNPGNVQAVLKGGVFVKDQLAA